MHYCVSSFIVDVCVSARPARRAAPLTASSVNMTSASCGNTSNTWSRNAKPYMWVVHQPARPRTPVTQHTKTGTIFLNAHARFTVYSRWWIISIWVALKKVDFGVKKQTLSKFVKTSMLTLKFDLWHFNHWPFVMIFQLYRVLWWSWRACTPTCRCRWRRKRARASTSRTQCCCRNSWHSRSVRISLM